MSGVIPLTRDDIERHVRGFFEAMDSGDLDKVAPYFDERTTWTVHAAGLPGDGSRVGWDAIVRDIVGEVRETVFEPGDPKADIHAVLVDGDRVAVEMTARGRLRSGGDYENHYVFIFELDDARFREVREYMDSHYAATNVFGM
jgi:ketosteroid isomerase-like protein